MTEAALIAVDWGTTNCRAYLLDRSGAVLDRVSARRGILNVPGGDFAAAYRDLVGRWQTPAGTLPALLAGMIGSRNGWVEAAYVECPADPALLGRSLMRVPGGDGAGIWVVPGIACINDGVHDVIRGEETQITGAVALRPETAEDTVFCMPGTHCKWVRVRNGAIDGFRTAMTGEVFSILKQHSILGSLMADTPPVAGAAFERGLERARAEGGLLHHLFGVRGEALFGAVCDTELADYLSGILIGHEVSDLGGGGAVTLIGSEALNERYRRALAHAGRTVETVSGDEAVVAGLHRIAGQVGILEAKT